jgi:hypothetical protein
MVRHAHLRLYTIVLKKFEDFQLKVSETEGGRKGNKCD